MALYVTTCPCCGERIVQDVGADISLKDQDILSKEDFRRLCRSRNIFVKEVYDNESFKKWQEANA